MAKRRIAVGDVVQCTFLDHSEDGTDVMLFEVFGRMSAITSKAYTIVSWAYVNAADRAKDSNPDNEKNFCIVRKAVTDIKVLK